MPCYLKSMAVNLQAIVKKEAERQGKKQPTKAITREVLKNALKYGRITPAKYAQLISIVDACVEEKHVHEHEKVRA